MKKQLLQKYRGVFLALIGFLCVISIQAQTWTAPVPVGSVMTNNQQYYVYNVGSKAFLDRGGENDAQAIVTPSTGSVITTVQNSSLWNLEFENSSAKCLKYNSGPGWTYTDGAAASYPWNVQLTDAVNNVYSIQLPSTFTSDYNASQYLGTSATLYYSNKEGTVYDVRFNRTTSDYTKWMFVTATDLAKYNAQVLLDKYMSIAKYVGSSVDLTSWISTYNTGTTADINAAVTTLKAALTVVDKTSSITNPGFGTDATGWTNPNGGTTGNSEIEFYQKNPFSFYQTVTGLTPGVYVVKMQGFQRTVALASAARTAYTNGSDILSAKFYATASNKTSFIPIRNIFSETTCTVGTTVDGLKFPNGKSDAQTAFTAGLYDNELETVVVDGSGSLTLGISGVYVNGITGQWQVIDNFRLYYYGALTTTTWTGSAWSNGTPTAYVNAVINGTYTGPGLTCYSLDVNAATTFTSDATINGILTLNNTLTIGGVNILTISNSVSGASTITATTGTVVFNGSSVQQSCPLTGTVANLTVNNGAGVVLANPITVNGTLTLTSGQLDNGTKTLTLANGATIVRTAGSLSIAPTFGTSVNVTYDGNSNITMGNEVTGYMNTGVLNNLTVSNGISVTPGNKIAVAGNLNLAQSNSVLSVANNGNDVTLVGDMLGSGYINGNSKGISVSCNGFSPQTLRLTNTTNLNVNNPAGVTLGKDLGFTGTTNANVNLSVGQLNLSSYALTLNAGNTINRVSGTLNGTPTFNTTVNVGYLNTTQSSTTTNGGTSVTLSGANTSIVAGMGVTGTGIAAGTTVASVSGTSLTLSQAATASATNTLTYSTAFTTGSEIPTSASVLGNLTINTSSGVTLGSNATVNGTLTFTSGNLTTGSNTLTLTKSTTPTSGSGYIVTGSTGTVVYSGSSSPTISNLSGAVYNLTVNNAAILGAATTVSGTLTLTSGQLTNTNTLTFANGATIVRSAGSLSAVPAFGTSVNVNYIGAVTTGNELPTTALYPNVLNNLIVNNATGVTLGASTTVNGTLSLTTGTLTTGNNTLTLKDATSGTGFIDTGISGTLAYGGTTEQTLANTTLTNSTVNNLVVNAGSKLTLSGSTITATNFTINSDASNGTGTILNGGLLASTAINANQYLADARNWYVSSPVSNALAPGGYTYYRYNEAAANWTSSPVAVGDQLIKGVGYIALPGSAASTLTFTTQSAGTLNAGNVDITLSRSGATKTGFNLIGNPYPAHLTWNKTFVDSLSTFIEPTIWYRTNGGTVNNSGQWSFKTYNASTDEASPLGTTNIIPPMQAFWVRALQAGTLTLNGRLGKSHQSSNPLKALAVKNTDRQRVRLEVSNGVATDEALVYFDANAANAYDTYDSPKMSNNIAAIPEIYTQVNGQKLVINGMNSIVDNLEIPLGFTTGQSNTFTIKATQLSNIDVDTKVYLKDNTQINPLTELVLGQDYTFTSDVTTDNTTRFSLLFKAPSVTTGVDVAKSQSVRVFANENSQIVIERNVQSDNNAEAYIYNAVGQLMQQLHLNNTITTSGISYPCGTYFVTIRGNKQTTSKVIVNKI